MSSAAAPHRAHCDQVLVVDVSQPGLAARKMVLEEQGLSVATARSAEEAIQRLSEIPLQLMVAVHHASQLDARELIRQVRRLKPGLPVILVCTNADALG
ncbi:MAG: response regulator, partial [Bryobacteraceae bacterium]|nr:response regulator [Bryobacteraceae bacterium]